MTSKFPGKLHCSTCSATLAVIEQIYSICKYDRNPLNLVSCEFYLAGLAGGAYFWDSNYKFCVPHSDITIAETREILLKFLDAHPGSQEEEAELVFFSAMNCAMGNQARGCYRSPACRELFPAIGGK